MWMYPEIQKQQVECRQTLQNRMNFNSLPCVVVVCWGGFSCTIFFNCFNCSGRHMTPGTFGNDKVVAITEGHLTGNGSGFIRLGQTYITWET